MASLPTLTLDDVRARRLHRHALTSPPPDASAAGVIREMHAAHAQVMSAAELSVGLRLAGSTRTTVRNALAEHSVTKTFGPRGTVHLVPTRDLSMWTGTLRSIPAGRSPFAADVQLSQDQTREVVAAVADALDGRDLTLEELDAAVVERTGAWAGDLVMPAFQTFWPRWRQAVSAAAQEGALVFGAGRGRKVSYTAPRNVDRSFAPDPAAEAIPAFLRGYLHAYGPATPAHLARWVGSSVDWASRAFEAGEVEPVLVDGTQAWVNAGDTDPHELGRSVLLLPYFDALAVGFFPREDLFPGRAGDRALARGQAGNYPVLLVDGVVRGVWHPKRSGSRVHVTVETWADLTGRRVRALEEQVARVGEILEGQADLTLGPVSVGPHA